MIALNVKKIDHYAIIDRLKSIIWSEDVEDINMFSNWILNIIKI